MAKKIVIISTNIIRGVLTENQDVHKKFYASLTDNIIIAFSVITFVQLKQHEEMLEKLVAFCVKYSAVLISDCDKIYTLEKKFYPHKMPNDQIILYRFENTQEEETEMLEYFKSKEFKKGTTKLVQGQKKALKDFDKTQKMYLKHNLEQKEIAWVVSTSLDDKEKIKIHENIILNQWGMASEILRTLIEYYKYAIKRTDIEESDPFDLGILSCTPYVDIVLTENTHAAILRNLKKTYLPLKNLKVYTMENLKENSFD